MIITYCLIGNIYIGMYDIFLHGVKVIMFSIMYVQLIT